MQGKKSLHQKTLYNVSLSDLVPDDNFYQKLDKTLNFNFLYKRTTKYYGSEGQESIDPVVFFKIILIGYLNKVGSIN